MWAAKYVSSAVVGEKIPEEIKSKTFYDLKAPLPGSKGTYDFVSVLPCDQRPEAECQVESKSAGRH